MRLPKHAVQKLNLKAGNSVEIREASHGRTLSIIPVRRHVASLAEMVTRITKRNQHRAADWGDAIGKEIW